MVAAPLSQAELREPLRIAVLVKADHESSGDVTHATGGDLELGAAARGPTHHVLADETRGRWGHSDIVVAEVCHSRRQLRQDGDDVITTAMVGVRPDEFDPASATQFEEQDLDSRIGSRIGPASRHAQYACKLEVGGEVIRDNPDVIETDRTPRVSASTRGLQITGGRQSIEVRTQTAFTGGEGQGSVVLESPGLLESSDEHGVVTGVVN
jgi:hypothetical protein